MHAHDRQRYTYVGLYLQRNEPVVELRFSNDEVVNCLKHFLHGEAPWNLLQSEKKESLMEQTAY